MSKLTTGPCPLIAILTLAALLRVWGLTWGLPSATHYFSYHPDESRVLQVAMFNMNLFTGHLLPHFYNYGSLQLYLVNLANSLAFLAGSVDIVPKDLPVWYPQWARMYLIGRGLSVAMGVGTVWVTGALGSRLWGRRAGLLAALLLAITPLHAQHSHWLTVDVPATFWVALSLLWTAKMAPPVAEAPPALYPAGEARPAPNFGGARTPGDGSVLPDKTLTPPELGVGGPPDPPGLGAGGASATGYRAGGAWKPALLAGLFAGLATATKYNMALALVPLVVMCVVPSSRAAGAASRLKPLAVGLAAALGAFLIACPGVLLETGRFLADLRFEAIHVNNADDPTFKDTGSGFVYHVTHSLDAGLGLPLLLLSLASVAYALSRRGRGDGLLAAFALPYYLVIGLAAVRYARYVVPLLPILALWSGRLLADLSRLRDTAARQAGLAIGAAALALTLGDAWLVVRPMANPDNRDVALRRINGLAPAPATVGFAAMPWFGSPPVSPYFPAPLRGGWRASASPQEAARIVYTGRDWDMRLLRGVRPPVIVLSEYDYDDALRLRDPDATAFVAALRRDYTRRFVFSDGASASTYDTVGGMPTRDLPHDMLYPNPILSVYQRKQ